MAAPVHAGIDWAVPAPPKPVSRWSYDIIRPLIRLSIVLKWKNINFLPSEAYGMICGCYYPARVWREWTNKNPERDRETRKAGVLLSVWSPETGNTAVYLRHPHTPLFRHLIMKMLSYSQSVLCWKGHDNAVSSHTKWRQMLSSSKRDRNNIN